MAQFDRLVTQALAEEGETPRGLFDALISGLAPDALEDIERKIATLLGIKELTP
jgi:hypothetical protein